MIPLFIDSDNAHGSPWGDVDDAFAIAAILLAGVPVSAIASVAGNTSERRAFANNFALASRARYHGPLLRGFEVTQFLRDSRPARILALGPLTNVAAALAAGAMTGEVILVGGNTSSAGRWPPWWPHEFNLTRDRRAARQVFQSGAALTIFPLDVARRLSVRRQDLDDLQGEVGAFLRRGARRWFLRLRMLKGSGFFPIYDLAAALYALDCTGFTMERTTAAMRTNTWLEFGIGSRPVTVCRALDREVLWRRFTSLVTGGPAPHSTPDGDVPPTACVPE